MHRVRGKLRPPKVLACRLCFAPVFGNAELQYCQCSWLQFTGVVQQFWAFDLKDALQMLFDDPEFCAARATQRDMTEAGFYGSAFAAEIDRSSNGMFLESSSSGYELTGTSAACSSSRTGAQALLEGGAVLWRRSCALLSYCRFAMAQQPACVRRALGSEPWPVRLACKPCRSCIPAMHAT